MMSGQLLISGLIEHAEKYHSDAEVVSRTVEGPILDILFLMRLKDQGS